MAKIISKYTQNIDKHITPHKMRSTGITMTYEKTGDIYIAANLAGHKNIANTRRYAKIDEKAKRKVANLLDVI